MLKERPANFPVQAFLLAAFLLLVAGCKGQDPEPTSAQYNADRDSIAMARNIFDLALSPRSGAEPIRPTGRNQLVLRRQNDDSWKLARVIGYGDG